MRNANPALKPRPGIEAALNELIAQITVDAYGEDEQLWAFRQAFEDDLAVPGDAFVIGEPVSVVKFDYDGNDRRGLTAKCRRPRVRRRRFRCSISARNGGREIRRCVPQMDGADTTSARESGSRRRQNATQNGRIGNPREGNRGMGCPVGVVRNTTDGVLPVPGDRRDRHASNSKSLGAG